MNRIISLAARESKLSVSVVIVTRNRQNKLFDCVESLFKNARLPDEVIIINEGSPVSRKLKKYFISHLIKVVDLPATNLSLGRNEGVFSARSDIICFTDDDCLTSPEWISEILTSFKKYPGCGGVFGNVLAFDKTKIRNRYCPCTFDLKLERLISKPVFHVTDIGYGNNMAFKSSVFTDIKRFKPWLGVGSVGMSAEDAEFALRTLIKGYQICHNPKAIVYHNRWLTPKARLKQNLLYSGGQIACYGYFVLQGYLFARPVVRSSFRDMYWKLRSIIGSTVKLQFNRKLISAVFWFGKEMVFLVRGISVAVWYSLMDPI